MMPTLDSDSIAALLAQAAGCSNVTELRRTLSQSLRTGQAKWLRLDGLSVNSLRTHDGLQMSLRSFGAFGDLGLLQPSIVVLDWGSAFPGDADGLAFFPILSRLLIAAGAKVIACMPNNSNLASIVEKSDCVALAGEGISWIPGVPGVPGSYEPVAPVILLPNGKGQGLGALINCVEQRMRDIGCSNVIDLTSSLLVELIQNVQAHSDCTYAGIGTVLLKRRRPPVLQVGIADDGVGIAVNLLSQPRHAWLGQFCDATIAETTLAHEMSGREVGNGGSLGALMRKFLGETCSQVILRTGTAHLSMSSEAPDAYRTRSLTYGVGTQLLIEIKTIS
jgi:hypothetical protein